MRSPLACRAGKSSSFKLQASRAAPARGRRERGFLLLEVVVAVAIFALGAVAIGRVMAECLATQRIRFETERARLILQNRMAEIQAATGMPDDLKRRALRAPFEGYTLTEKRIPLNLRNDDGTVLGGMNEVQLTVEWEMNGQKLQRSISFYLLRGS